MFDKHHGHVFGNIEIDSACDEIIIIIYKMKILLHLIFMLKAMAMCQKC